jgi:hypothetical protein
MILSIENSEHQKYRIFDVAGSCIDRVHEYNTKTKEIALYIRTVNNKDQSTVIYDDKGPYLAKFILEGSYALYFPDGNSNGIIVTD